MMNRGTGSIWIARCATEEFNIRNVDFKKERRKKARIWERAEKVAKGADPFNSLPDGPYKERLRAEYVMGQKDLDDFQEMMAAKVIHLERAKTSLPSTKAA